MLPTQAFCSGISGRTWKSVLANFMAVRPIDLAVDADFTAGAIALSGEHLHQLALAVARNAGDADDLVRPDLERKLRQRFDACFVVGSQLRTMSRRVRLAVLCR